MGRGLRRRMVHRVGLPKMQRGAALLFVVLLTLLGVGLFVTNAWQETARVTVSDRLVAQRLNEAKEALISVAVGHPQRPGALPCPDTDGDGASDPPPVTQAACTSNIGLLPWRTLGTGDLRDASGELLWYALSPNFRHLSAINSDTKGSLVVRSSSATVTQTDQAVAIVFAPGGVLEGQDRSAGSAVCATTATNMARTLCPSNYLETAAGINNASATGPYIMADATATFNDRLIVLRASDVIPNVEKRVATDIRRVLTQYQTAQNSAIAGNGCSCYPWPDGDNDGTGNTGDNKGRIPLVATPNNWGTSVQDGKGVIFQLPTLPAYFQANNWHTVLFYAVGRSGLEGLGALCTTCTLDLMLPPPPILEGTLSIDGAVGHAVILITPGSAGANRPSTSWGDYIDDPANRDGDDHFVKPASTSRDRDRLHTIAGEVYSASCNTNAKMLVREAPCHLTGTAVKPVCQQAVHNLGMCAQCSGAAKEMVNTPCRNTLNPPECQTAVGSLQGCKA